MKAKEIILRGNSKDDLYCEITDVLNQYNVFKNRASQLYICPHPEGCLVIRGVGATRGCIRFDEEYVITEVLIYDDYNYGKGGIFKVEDKSKILEEMKKFIGYKIA